MNANQIENMSLFIPHIFTSVGKNEIQDIIENDCKFGKIKQIDLVSKFDQTHYYNMAYIHFEYWFNNENNNEFQKKVRAQDNSAKIYYEKKNNKFSEHFWIVLENRAKKIVSGERKPKLILEPLKSEESKNVQIQTPMPKQLTNKDFSNLMNAPIKNKEKMEDIIDEYIDSCAKKLQFGEENEIDDEYPEESEIDNESCDLVSSDYAQFLENKIEYLMNLVEFLKKDNINLMNINESLQKENQKFQRTNRSSF